MVKKKILTANKLSKQTLQLQKNLQNQTQLFFLLNNTVHIRLRNMFIAFLSKIFI